MKFYNEIDDKIEKNQEIYSTSFKNNNSSSQPDSINEDIGKINKIAKVKNNEKLFNSNKKRNIPHINGNFSCSIFIKVKKSKKIIIVKDKINEILCNSIKEESYINNNINTEFLELKEEEYHISISRTFFLKFHQIIGFIELIKEKLNSNIQLKNGLSFLVLKKIQFFNNEQNTRFFLALEILKSAKIKILVEIINDILKEYNIVPYYKVNFLIQKIYFY